MGGLIPARMVRKRRSNNLNSKIPIPSHPHASSQIKGTYIDTFNLRDKEPVLNEPNTRVDDPKQSRVLPEKPWYETFVSFQNKLDELEEGHRMLCTKEHYHGLGPLSVAEGGEVWVLRGGKVSFVLRRNDVEGEEGGERSYNLVGEAYVHGGLCMVRLSRGFMRGSGRGLSCSDRMMPSPIEVDLR